MAGTAWLTRARAAEAAVRKSGRRSAEMPLAPRPVQRRVERGADRGEHLVDLVLGDDHRRAEGEGVADRPADHPARGQLVRQPRPDLAGRGEALGRAVRRELERRPSARGGAPRRPADARQPVEMRGEARRQRADPGGDVQPLVDLQRLHPDRAGRPGARRRCSRGRRCRSCRSSPRSPRPCPGRSPPPTAAGSPRSAAWPSRARSARSRASAPRTRRRCARSRDHLVGDHQDVVLRGRPRPIASK